jgi:protein required for attachment to host cells
MVTLNENRFSWSTQIDPSILRFRSGQGLGRVYNGIHEDCSQHPVARLSGLPSPIAKFDTSMSNLCEKRSQQRRKPKCERYTWILVANAAEARFFQFKNLRTDKLELIKELKHADSLKKVTDLVSDKPGHYRTSSGARGSYEKADPKEHETQIFMMQLIQELKAAHDKKKYEDLIIVTPAHFYGLLQKHLSNHNIPAPKHVPKDYTKYDVDKLMASLKKHLLWEYKDK